MQKFNQSSNTYCIKGVLRYLEVEKCENIPEERITDDIFANFLLSSHQKCVTDNNDCKKTAKIFTDKLIDNIEETSEKLASSLENGKCYYNGGKCAKANSCETIAETTLTSMALEVLCTQFSTWTKNCVADGKKFKFQELGEGGETIIYSSSKRLNLSFAILFLVLITVFGKVVRYTIFRYILHPDEW